MRFLPFPFTVIFGAVVSLRNAFYNWGIFKSYRPKMPVILVGNLSTGGTGKTPHIAYLINLFASRFRLAILSRGYGRKTSGFVLASKNSTASEIGDEPLQFFQRFSDISVAVQENRKKGILNLQAVRPDLQAILMDDGFQHRAVNPAVKILLTPYENLYTDDFLLPVGNLREPAKNAKRADIIVVTKCPEDVSQAQEKYVIEKLKPLPKQKLFFTKIVYAPFVYRKNDKISINDLKKYEVLLVTGIAQPKPLLQFLTAQKINFTHLSFPDHHYFTKKDHAKIQQIFNGINAPEKIILTTEKDATRLQTKTPLFQLKISVDFFTEKSAQAFEKEVLTLANLV